MFSNATEGVGWQNALDSSGNTVLDANGRPVSFWTGADTAGKGKGSGGGNFGGYSNKDLLGIGMNMLKDNTAKPGVPDRGGQSALGHQGGGHASGNGAADVLGDQSLTQGLNNAKASALGQNAPPTDQDRFLPYTPPPVSGSSLIGSSYSPSVDALIQRRQFGSSPMAQTSLLSPNSSSLLGRFG